MSERNKRFLTDMYFGADGDDFRKEYIEYLENILAKKSFESMNDTILFLQGGRTAIEEIIEEIRITLPPEDLT